MESQNQTSMMTKSEKKIKKIFRGKNNECKIQKIFSIQTSCEYERIRKIKLESKYNQNELIMESEKNKKFFSIAAPTMNLRNMGRVARVKMYADYTRRINIPI